MRDTTGTIPVAREPSAATTGQRRRLVVVGGGFGGITVARRLAGTPWRITLIDRQSYHCFQPLLYQVATGALSAPNVAAPLRTMFARQDNVRVMLGEMIDLDADQREVVLSDGVVPYDQLVVATGSSTAWFGNKNWREVALGLKTLDDATAARARILTAFETADRETDPAHRQAWLTFVVVGGGPTGVEMAGAIAELARHTLAGEFRSIGVDDVRVVLVDEIEDVLESFPAVLRDRAGRDLRRLGVEMRFGKRATAMDGTSITLGSGEHADVLATRTIVWAAGVEASQIGAVLARAFEMELGPGGRVPVDDRLRIPGHDTVRVIGDLADAHDAAGNPLPGLAPVAVQQGRFVARDLRDAVSEGGRARPSFRYRHQGTMATIGRRLAVVDLGWCRFGGTVAWLTWLFVHLMQLVFFSNRILVFTRWLINYVTYNRTARLITGRSPLPLDLSDRTRDRP